MPLLDNCEICAGTGTDYLGRPCRRCFDRGLKQLSGVTTVRDIKSGDQRMPKHPFENTSEGGPKYEELSNVISIEGLSYEPGKFLDDELDILQPRLVALGYTEIKWSMGESDSHGPLTRICTARDAAGEVRAFIYG